MRRFALATTTVLALVALTTSPTVSASVASPTQASTASRPMTDFDGDGHPDFVVGSPGEDVGNVVDAGAVSVRARKIRVLTQNSAIVGGSAERGDHFGASFAAGDFNGDGFTDLAVGAPTEDVGSVADAGAVNVIYGSTNGLAATGHQVFTQNSSGVGSSAERGDLFGFALTAGDFDNDGRTDLAVGVRHEDAAAFNGGAVNVLYGTPTGLTGSGSQLFTQNNAGTGNHAESGDLFGSALAAGDFDGDGYADLAVGVPHEDLLAVEDAGAVNLLRGSAHGLTGTGGRLFTEDSPGVAGTAEAGDEFGTALATGDLDGDSYADLAVGVPAEDVGAAANAGAAYLLKGSSAGLTGAGSRLFSENAPYHPDVAEAGDRYGFSLVLVDLFGSGPVLVVGAPGEDVGSVEDAGAVYVGAAEFREGDSEFAGTPNPGDRLGASLAAWTTGVGQGDVLAGVPGENGGAGAVMIIYGGTHENDGDQLPPSGALISQNNFGVPGASEPGDFFGEAVAGW